jgi:hypothetical protein
MKTFKKTGFLLGIILGFFFLPLIVQGQETTEQPGATITFKGVWEDPYLPTPSLPEGEILVEEACFPKEQSTLAMLQGSLNIVVTLISMAGIIFIFANHKT